MAKRKKFIKKTKGIPIPDSQYRQIEQVIERKGDFSSPAEYVRHCIREQLKRDTGGGK